MQQSLLFIDDCESTRALVDACLSPLGINFVGHSDASSGLAAAMHWRPDIILLDIDLPDANGFQVLSEMRRSPSLLHVPIIFLSALKAERVRTTGLELGAIDFLSKPFQPAEFQARISVALDRQRVVESARRARVRSFMTGCAAGLLPERAA